MKNKINRFDLHQLNIEHFVESMEWNFHLKRFILHHEWNVWIVTNETDLQS